MTKFTLVCNRGYKVAYKTWYSEEDIDYFILYSLELDEIYMVHINDVIGQDTLCIRHLPVISRQVKNINNSYDYLLENVIEHIYNNNQCADIAE